MDEPPAKRRKTVSPAGTDRPLSPLKQPPRRPSLASQSMIRADRQSSPLKEPPRRPSISTFNGALDRSSPLKQPPRRRPSFASPTKASLARNYPNLLPERPSLGTAGGGVNGRNDMLSRGKEARAFVMGDKDGRKDLAAQDPVNGDGQTSAGALQQPASPSRNVTPRPRKTLVRDMPLTVEDVPEEEADLPATPSQMGAEDQDTPRRGILYSSPTKRPPREKNPPKPSPLKPKAPPVQPDRPDIPLDEPVQDEKIPTAERRERQPPDVELEKRKHERGRLLQELEDLEDQVSGCVNAITKIQVPSELEVIQPDEQEDFISFIHKITKPEDDTEDDHPPAISGLLCSFLPFSAHRIPQPKSRQAQQEPVASHQPLQVDDPLPYLEMFTDLKISTQLDLPRGRLFPSSNRVHQKHVVDITGPQKLLTVSISIIIDTINNCIVDLQVLRLASWAQRELGQFMRARAQAKDLGNACWAIGSYWDVAKRRAEFWHKCETSFGRLLPERAKEDKEKRTKLKVESSISRKDLSRNLGRDVLTLEDRNAMLRIQWIIEFDWTGEAQSDVRVEPAVPAVWREADKNGSLKKIPETFTSLLQSKGVFAATKTMVALLFAES